MSTAQRYVPYAFARDHGILLRPASERDAEAWISESTPLAALNEVMRVFPGRVTPVMVEPAALREAIAQTYAAGEGSAQQIVGDIEGEFDISRMLAEVPDVEDLLETEDDAPIIRMINALLTQAARDGASDIHIEPYEKAYRVRYRIDGVLHQEMAPPIKLKNAITSRMKIMATLDIAERRLPQDGRIELVVSGNPVDLRVSVLPTLFGESVVMRVLDRVVVSLDLENVGMDAPMLRRFREVIERPNGIVLVTGPTGSGKTTTLYASINQLDSKERNIITIEDPVEYRFADINQMQVNPQANITFARGLRATMRLDPDVILVGEMRDYETIETALLAAETGHLVFSTLHTLDATETVNRIISVFPPHQQKQIRLQLAGVLKAVVSMRLIPRADCHGRVPACEVMIATPFIRDCIINKDKTKLIHEAIAAGVSQYGMQTFDQSLMKLYREEKIDYETARMNSTSPTEFELRAKGIEASADQTWKGFDR